MNSQEKPQIPNTPTDQARVLSSSFLNASKLLGFREREVATFLDIDPTTFSRQKQKKDFLKPHTIKGKRALLFIRIYRSLDAILGGEGEEKNQHWLASHNHALQGTPKELILDPQGLVHVVEYLDAMRAKI